MPADYRLIYFDGRGRAELIRLIFAAAFQKFEDVRIDVAKWPEYKLTTPWGGIPILEVNNRPVAQSGAIVRYLARQFHLAGEDKWEQVLVDSALDAIGDLLSAAISLGESQDGPLEKADNIRKFRDHVIPVALTNYDRFISMHGNNGFTVGNHITAADIALFNFVDSVLHHNVLANESLALYPAVKIVFNNVKAQPRIAAYLISRPDSKF
ncbi:putative Hematopoietic prostaglandin D synthase [Hypsibius exemplaris]|uniref:glutathione transferase n=1 Tax=Hypsibius exemplaris TaxID=2072580 RepID=A0A9X6NKS5_HYPEX|nr:putative Hematopoietic prostaglandin D synthase [Hypsibius exemplaris]